MEDSESDNQPNHSISECLVLLKKGDTYAQYEIWQRYHKRLVRLAYLNMKWMKRRVVDEEDVALSAFALFLQRAKEGRFPKLEDRHDLWQVLIMLTERRAVSQRRHQTAQKRGGDQVRGESGFDSPRGSLESERGIEAVMDRDPPQAFIDCLCESVEERLNALGSDLQRKIAIAKMEGFTNAEISQRLNVSERTIERQLNLIRKTWTQ